MRRFIPVVIILLMLLAIISSVTAQDGGEGTAEPAPVTTEAPEMTEEPAEVTPSPTPISGEFTTYTVVPGDNLFRIAVRNGTTVRVLADFNGIVNPALIFVGQQIRIPASGSTGGTPPPPAETPDPTVTPTPGETTTYIVQRGDTLYRIAINNGTTVQQMVQANNLSNANFIYVGQQLTIPAGGSGGTNTTPPTTSVTPSAPLSVPFAYGVELFTTGANVTTLSTQAQQLGVGWVKIEVNWSDIEASQGLYTFDSLDSIISTLSNAGFDILVTVRSTPAWARSHTNLDAPPDDFSTFGTFMGVLAARYGGSGQIDAYQIWSEPNLRREWNVNNDQHSINAADYVELVRVAYAAIKAADADALVITAGLAPTNVDDGFNAINDRTFLQRMYDNGIADVSDGIGVHPFGWANPPDARCCDQPTGVETHYEHPTFYFLNTVEAYRSIMVQNGDSTTSLWITRFSWGTSEDTTSPIRDNVFVTYTSLSEQALYIPRAFELGRELGFVGPMFVSSLNGCERPTEGLVDPLEYCYYSLIGPNSTQRPSFNTVQQAITSAPADETTTQPVDEPAATTDETMTDTGDTDTTESGGLGDLGSDTSVPDPAMTEEPSS